MNTLRCEPEDPDAEIHVFVSEDGERWREQWEDMSGTTTAYTTEEIDPNAGCPRCGAELVEE